MTTSTFNKAPDIPGQIVPGATKSFLLVEDGSGNKIQTFVLYDSTGAVISGSNPLPVSAAISGTPNINVAQYGGVATSLGQKAKAASVPVVLANEQSVSEYDSTNAVYFNRIGVPWQDVGGGISGWKPWPIAGDGQASCTPLVACATAIVGSSSLGTLTQDTTGPGSGALALQTRSLLYGVNGLATAAPSVLNAAPSTEYGLVTRNIPSGTQAVTGTITAVTSITNALPAGTNTLGSVKTLSGRTTVTSGRQAVATAGTAVQFSSNACNTVTFQALHTNTKRVSLGDSTTALGAGSEKGILLQPGQVYSTETDNVNRFWINSEVNGEGCTFNYS